MPCSTEHGQQEVVKVVELDIFDELERLLKAEEEAQKKGIAKGKIVRVEKGKRKDFTDEEKLREWGLNPEEEVLRFVIETDWGDNIVETYRISTNKRSYLFKFYVNYGRPQIGKEVTLKYDKVKNRWRVLL